MEKYQDDFQTADVNKIPHLSGYLVEQLKIHLSSYHNRMKPRVASYFRNGYTMSRRARISHKRNEHPITHWISELAIDKETIKKMLVYAGVHHTGLYAQRTRFYRLPNLKNESEFDRFFRTFHSIPATKRKFINYMSRHLQESILAHKERKFYSSDKYIKSSDRLLK